MKRRVVYAWKWLVCAVALALVGCASPLNVARLSVTAAATLGRTAGDLVASINADKQEEIAAAVAVGGGVDLARGERDTWRAKRAIVIKALRVYNATVVGAAAAVELAGAKKDTITLSLIVTQLAAAAGPLRDALRAFGVTIPGGL